MNLLGHSSALAMAPLVSQGDTPLSEEPREALRRVGERRDRTGVDELCRRLNDAGVASAHRPAADHDVRRLRQIPTAGGDTAFSRAKRLRQKHAAGSAALQHMHSLASNSRTTSSARRGPLGGTS